MDSATLKHRAMEVGHLNYFIGRYRQDEAILQYRFFPMPDVKAVLLATPDMSTKFLMFDEGVVAPNPDYCFSFQREDNSCKAVRCGQLLHNSAEEPLVSCAALFQIYTCSKILEINKAPQACLCDVSAIHANFMIGRGPAQEISIRLPRNRFDQPEQLAPHLFVFKDRRRPSS